MTQSFPKFTKMLCWQLQLLRRKLRTLIAISFTFMTYSESFVKLTQTNPFLPTGTHSLTWLRYCSGSYTLNECHWLDYLTETGKMLLYIVAAGHNKYRMCLLLYLKEIKDLEMTYPTFERIRHIEHRE